MEEIYCPYCERGFDLNHDDGAYYDEEHRTECTCPWCDKKFMVSASLSWDFDAEKADCLNGGEHVWDNKYRFSTNPKNMEIMICKECDKEKND